MAHTIVTAGRLAGVPGSSRTGRRVSALMAASGFASLGLQMVWTRQGALWLGHEAPAVLAVVAAFFGGLALGAFALGGRIARSARPGRWYAGCEAVVGFWGAVLALTMGPVAGGLLRLIGEQPSALRQWGLAFGGVFVLLLPATAAMGATLPAMERLASALRGRVASVAALYAANTFGAVLGVLGSAFVLVPALGLSRTALACAALNAGCAAVAWRLPGWGGSAGVAAPAAVVTAGERRLPWLLAGSGLLGIGYEVLAVRVLSQVAHDTVYTFALLLAVYLVGTALGAAAWARWSAAGAGAERRGEWLPGLLAVACLAGTGSLWGAQPLRDAVLALVPGSAAAALGAETLLAVAAFVLPTLAMGAWFSHLAARARDAGFGLGRALAVNTLGAALAPPLFGLALAPLLGAKASLLLLAGAYLALLPRRCWARPAPWGAAGGLLALALWAPPLAFVDVPEGGRILSYREGAMGAVSVVEDAAGVAVLRIDNREQEGSSATVAADARQALLPLLLHPAPRRALFLGLGTGVTALSAAQDAQLQVDVVELLPEVIEAAPLFARAVGAADAAQRLHVVQADARRFARTAPRHWDVVVADNFHPARSGSGALYTVEHFQAVRKRLAPGGLFCQWLPLHQLDLGTLRSILRSFLAVYPDGLALLATHSLSTPVLGLLGRADGAAFEPARLRARLAGAALPQPPAAFGLDDELALLGSFVAGPRALARFAGDAPLNTDDRPVVAYGAPRLLYAPDSQPQDRLLALLDELTVEPSELLGSRADRAFSRRLQAWWRARDAFLAAGRGVRPAADVRVMLAQVREPLLAVLRTSPEFRPAREPLQRMAQALAASDPAAAQALQAELAQLP